MSFSESVGCFTSQLTFRVRPRDRGRDHHRCLWQLQIKKISDQYREVTAMRTLILICLR